MKEEGHREFFTKMAEMKLRIPNINVLNMCLMINERDFLPQFLLHCVPHSLQHLYINSAPWTLSFPCDSYCFELAEAIKRVTLAVHLTE